MNSCIPNTVNNLCFSVKELLKRIEIIEATCCDVPPEPTEVLDRNWFWDTELITDLDDYPATVTISGGGDALKTHIETVATSGTTSPHVVEIIDSLVYQGFLFPVNLSNLVIRSKIGQKATITRDPTSSGSLSTGWCVGLNDGNNNILMGRLIIDGTGTNANPKDVDGIDDRGAAAGGGSAIMRNLRFKDLELMGCDEGVDWDEDGNDQPMKIGIIFEDCIGHECSSNVSQSGGTGFGLDNVKGLIMRNCENFECERGFLFFDRCEDIILIQCSSHDNFHAVNSEGYKLDVKTTMILTCCVAYNSQNDEGFRLDDGAKAYFLNCIANNNAKDGFFAEDTGTPGVSTGVLINCISSNNGGYGLMADDGGTIYEAYTCLFNNTAGKINQTSGEGHIIQRPEKQVLADPLFVNPGTGDFELAAGSPCIGAGRYGTDLGIFPPDIQDRIVPLEDLERLRDDPGKIIFQTYMKTFYTKQ